jgi:hypothetical protein
MTPQPPPSSDGSSLPPRHRPTLGELGKDTTEMDLWAFDDDLDLEPVPQESTRATDLPGRRGPNPGTAKSAGEDKEPDAKLPPPGDLVRMNVSKPKFKARSGDATSPSKPESDFDDLDHWEDVPPDADIGELPVGPIPPVLVLTPTSDLEPASGKPAESAPALIEPPAEPPAEAAPAPLPQDDEFSPVIPKDAVPLSLRPRLGLTKVERAGLGILVVFLVAAAIGILVVSLNRLPTESAKAEETDFPIVGKHFTVESAKSYWRPPITDGPSPDTVRRGTALLPVVELKFERAAGGIRVLFRNEERAFVGDPINRTVNSPGLVRIAATAGFDDTGMHAAYRTGESKPWTIEVFEAQTEDAAGSDFKKLFEMNISAARR